MILVRAGVIKVARRRERRPAASFEKVELTGALADRMRHSPLHYTILSYFIVLQIITWLSLVKLVLHCLLTPPKAGRAPFLDGPRRVMITFASRGELPRMTGISRPTQALPSQAGGVTFRSVFLAA